MFQVYNNFSLKDFNTFNIDVSAKLFFACKEERELIDFLKSKQAKGIKTFLLGGGSNVLFTKNYDGLIINMQNTEIKIIDSDSDYTYIQADAGVEWDKFVEFCVENDLYGAENLSLIPGTVGAAPVQNIGAYGAEAKDIIFKVNAYELATCKKHRFVNEQCKFAYRSSIFKKKYAGKYVISSVIFKLNKSVNFNIEYGSIKEELHNFNEKNLKNIRQSILNIRRAKLPEPNDLPNAGSFFKNPVLNKYDFEKLKKIHPKLISYPAGENKVKGAAGQLIDLAGLKGYKIKDVSTYKYQALVIVNNGNASGNDILRFSEYIKGKVFDKFGIILEPEVNIL